MSKPFILIRIYKFKIAIKLWGILILDTIYMDISICKIFSTIPKILNCINFKDDHTCQIKIIRPSLEMKARLWRRHRWECRGQTTNGHTIIWIKHVQFESNGQYNTYRKFKPCMWGSETWMPNDIAMFQNLYNKSIADWSITFGTLASHWSPHIFHIAYSECRANHP